MLLPRAHAQGVKHVVVVVVVVVGTKIARSRVLGICAYCKHNQSVDIQSDSVKNRASNCSKGLSLGLVLQIVHFLFNMPVVIDHTHSFSMLMRLRMLKLSVGKGRQVIKQLCHRVLQYYAIYSGYTEHAGYVLYRALVLEWPKAVCSNLILIK